MKKSEQFEFQNPSWYLYKTIQKDLDFVNWRYIASLSSRDNDASFKLLLKTLNKGRRSGSSNITETAAGASIADDKLFYDKVMIAYDQSQNGWRLLWQ